MSDLLNQLLDTVDELTVTRVRTILQDIDGEKMAVATTSLPLIEWLRDAVGSSIGAESNGGALKSNRSVLNGEALMAYEQIETAAIKALGTVSSAVPFLKPEQNIRQWFIGFQNDVRAGKKSEDAVLEELNRWGGWVRRIEDLLWPPTQIEITSKCPQCGERWAKTKEGDSISAIVVEYRPPTEGNLNALSRSKATCRACSFVWRGDRKLRELRFEIDVADEAEKIFETPTEMV